jgi:hypothetical protein
MSDRGVVVARYSAGSRSRDTERLRSEPSAAEAAPKLAAGPSLLLALLLSLGLWGGIWWMVSSVWSTWFS